MTNVSGQHSAGAHGRSGPLGRMVADLRRRPDGGDDMSPPHPKVHVARAELVLARDDAQPLRAMPLKPDPLSGFARALEAVRHDLGETASIVVDLLPASPSERARYRKRLLASAGASDAAGSRRGGGVLDEVRAGLGHAPQRGGRGSRPAVSTSRLEGQVERRELRDLTGKLGDPEILFGLQVLLRTTSHVKGRPEAHLQALIACWEIWAGRNWLRVAGLNLGVVFLGADAPWSRRSFDERFDTGRFAPAKRTVVTAKEVAGWLKPPTVHCQAAGVVRSGGLIPPAPQGLPEFTAKRRDLLPLGRVSGPDGDRLVGVHLNDTVFAYMAGRSRFGKTETLINQFIHLARSGHGCFFLDPHEDGLTRIKPYLTDVADRVVEVNLAPRGMDHRQTAWNLFSMEGRTAEDMEMRMAAVVDSFASALRWGEINNRALTLTTMAAKSLLELALRLPAELAPTLFQITTLLSDEQWREAVLPWLSRDCQTFWSSRFTKLAADAITPVTNLIDRLASSSAVKGLLGASRSSYDIRRCMDEGKIVLACPAGTGDKDRLIANFLVYDLLQAALSRKDTPPEHRRPFYAFFDEVQTYDGASRGNLAALLEQAAKYGVRAFLANQNPERLTPATFDAVTTNRSHLATTTVNARAAQLLSREYGDEVTPRTIAALPKYTYLTSVTLGRNVTPPFHVRGVAVDELWAHCHRPDAIADLDAAVDRTAERRPIRDTAAELDTLDGRILEHLQARGRPDGPSAGAPPAHGPRGKATRASGLADDALIYDPAQDKATL